MGDASAPWWVKFATFFGVPALIAIYLVWHVTHIIVTPEMVQHTIDVRTTNELLQAHIKLSTALERRQEQQDQRIERVLQAICVNGADGPVARLKCVD